MAKTLSILAIILVLGGCSAVEHPIGVGRGTDELPASPCACEPFYVAGEWLA